MQISPSFDVWSVKISKMSRIQLSTEFMNILCICDGTNGCNDKKMMLVDRKGSLESFLVVNRKIHKREWIFRILRLQLEFLSFNIFQKILRLNVLKNSIVLYSGWNFNRILKKDRSGRLFFNPFRINYFFYSVYFEMVERVYWKV